ncbi:putative protein serine/threonine kinase [Tieghemostelium lacteum]|uniref:Uncharacterized protein n=1 Tax=Tieghemostelium lacteum TaxID=361077 RepID=A0A151ZI78_TIELA|nr:putative protein serine/threonine kinase [Tieghemostelium lacteum]|eukprot:KYQ93554.1 putative protein serine/threonine kinase [Tieghemostelium lacteum]
MIRGDVKFADFGASGLLDKQSKRNTFIELSPVLSQPNLPTIITPLTTEDRYLYNIPPTQTPLPNNLLNPYPTIPSLSSSEYSFGHISSQPIPQQYQHNRSTQAQIYRSYNNNNNNNNNEIQNHSQPIYQPSSQQTQSQPLYQLPPITSTITTTSSLQPQHQLPSTTTTSNASSGYQQSQSHQHLQPSSSNPHNQYHQSTPPQNNNNNRYLLTANQREEKISLLNEEQKEEIDLLINYLGKSNRNNNCNNIFRVKVIAEELLHYKKFLIQFAKAKGGVFSFY